MSEVDTSFLDGIADGLPGKTTVLDKPADLEKEPEKPEESQQSTETEEERPEDNQEVKDEKTKSPADYARERREAKKEREEMLKKYPELAKQNEEYEQKLAKTRTELEELRGKVEEKEQDETLESQSFETIKAENEMLKKMMNERRFAGRNSIDADEEVQRYARDTFDTLKAQLPNKIDGGYGEISRLYRLDQVQADPEKAPALNSALQHYYSGMSENNSETMDEAVAAVGKLLVMDDADPSTIHSQIDDALSAAMQPMMKGIARREFVSKNIHEVTRENHSQMVAKIEQDMLLPFLVPEDKAREVLKENPDHVWAKASLFLGRMPDADRANLQKETNLDAEVIARLEYNPLPAPGDSMDDLQNQQKAVKAAEARMDDLKRYSLIGRAAVEFGLLGEALDALERLEKAGVGAIPNRGDGGNGTNEATFLDSIPDQIRRR